MFNGLAIIVIPTTIILTGLLIYYFFTKYMDKLYSDAYEYTENIKKDFAENLPEITKEVGHTIAQNFRMSLMGTLGGKVRLEDGLKKALTTDVIDQQSPLLSMLLDMFPTGKKYITKHPDALGQLVGMFMQGGLPGLSQPGQGIGNIGFNIPGQPRGNRRPMT